MNESKKAIEDCLKIIKLEAENGSLRDEKIMLEYKNNTKQNIINHAKEVIRFYADHSMAPQRADAWFKLIKENEK